MAGLPISRLDDVRDLFRGLGVDMVGSSHLKQYLEFLQDEEKRRLSEVIGDEYYSVSFDGSPFWHQVQHPFTILLVKVLVSTER